MRKEEPTTATSGSVAYSGDVLCYRISSGCYFYNSGHLWYTTQLYVR